MFQPGEHGESGAGRPALVQAQPEVQSTQSATDPRPTKGFILPGSHGTGEGAPASQ